MSPGIRIEPDDTIKERQAYREGFEAGKASLRAELMALIRSLPDKQLFTSTYREDYWS